MKRVACLSFSLCVLLFSCKKSDDNSNGQQFIGCELSKMVDSSDALGIHAITSVSYDISGAMITSTTTGTTSVSRSLDYSSGSNPLIRISGSYSETDTLTLANGKITMIVAHNYSNTQNNKRSFYNYDASGQLQTRMDFYANGTLDTAYYTWANGDMISVQSRLDSFKYTYDTLKSQDGDWLRENQILIMGLGRTIITTQHEVHSVQHGLNAPTYFFYIKDANNRIVTCNAYTGSSLEVYTYSYYCTQ